MDIDKNVPIPANVLGKKYFFDEMQVGDSFFVRTKNTPYDKHKAAASITRCAKVSKVEGLKVTVRRVDNGVRCWRVA